MTVFDRLRQLEANATPGPRLLRGRWGGDRLVLTPADAEFIVTVRNLWGPLVAVAEAAARFEADRKRAAETVEYGWTSPGAEQMRDSLAALERAVKETTP